MLTVIYWRPCYALKPRLWNPKIGMRRRSREGQAAVPSLPTLKRAHEHYAPKTDPAGFGRNENIRALGAGVD